MTKRFKYFRIFLFSGQPMLEKIIKKVLVPAVLAGGVVILTHSGCKPQSSAPVSPYQPVEVPTNTPVNTPIPCDVSSVQFEDYNLCSADSGAIPRQNLVIKTQAAYDNFINLNPCMGDNNPFPPAIDFSQNDLVVVSGGMFWDSCHKIEIAAIETNCQTVTVKIHEYDTSDCTGCYTASIYPHHYVLIDKTSLPVNFTHIASDQDKDGFSDQTEIDAGTNKCDPGNHP